MKTGAALMTQSELARNVSNVALAALGVYWIALLPFALHREDGAAVGIDMLLVCACIYMLVLATLQGRGLGDATRVLERQRAPATLWHAWCRNALRGLLLRWALACVALTASALLPASTLSWPAAAAALSVTLSLATLRSLSRQGLLPRACGIAIDSACAIAAIAVALLASPAAAFNWFASLPAVPLLVLAASWPVLAALLMHLRQRVPAGYRWTQRAPNAGALAALKRNVLRYSAIQWRDTRADANNTASSGRLHRPVLGQLLSGMPVFYTQMLVWSAAQWTRPISIAHIYVVGFLCIFMASNLMIRDLHWRSLLVPGGLHRGRIATHIFISTMRAHLIGIAAISLLMLAGAALLHRAWVMPLLHAYLRYSVLLVELLCATGAAVLLRALPRAGWFSTAIFVALCFGVFHNRYQIFLGATQVAQNSPWAAGAGYAVGLLLGCVVMIAIANRLWTPKKLFPFGVSPRTY